MARRTQKTSRRRTRSAATSRRQNRLGRAISLTVLAVIALFAAYYVLTGVDPLGIFTPSTPTPTAERPTAVAPGGGGWWHVYFTDPQTVNDPGNLAGSIPESLIAYIDSAQRTIHVAAFEFNLTPVAEALVAAHRRGVEVRWVTDDEHGIEADAEEGHGQFAMLEKAGIEVRDDGRTGLMHDKFWIFDGRTVWTGSTNATVNDNFRNNNNVLVMESPEVAAIYAREFAEMWDGRFGPTSPSTADEQSVTVDGTPIQVLFAPEDPVFDYLLPLIESAQASIRIMAFSFTHDSMGDAVLARAGAGVDVKVIFETRSSETEHSELFRLHCAGVPARQDGNPGTFHHKVIIVDGLTVVTGSLNFSSNAEKSNDENVIIVTNRDIVDQYRQEFERRWAEATEPGADSVQCR